MPETRKKIAQFLPLFAGPVLALAWYFGNPLGQNTDALTVLAIAILMVCWWVLEALPLPVVALIPLIAFPLTGIGSLKEVATSYSDSMIFLFLGGFFLALGIEKWNLHKRIALTIVSRTGTDGNRIILGFILSTGFLSFWLSNTATTMMMFPIALSVIAEMKQQQKPGENFSHFATVLMMCIAYAANFGFGTIIATPPNVAYVAHIQERFQYSIGFADWMLLFMPLSFLMFFSLYFVTVKWLYPNHIKSSPQGKAYIQKTLTSLGPLSAPEKRVLAIFVCTVLLWIGKDLINHAQNLVKLDDTIISLTGGLLLFMIPSGNKSDKAGERLLHWTDTEKLAWGILILFGGGIALAKALENTGILQSLGQNLAQLGSINRIVLILAITVLSVFLSEVMSNVAQVIVMAPVISALALSLQMDPLQLGLPMAIGATCASMLPMGTPPNAIVFSSGHIRLKDMLKTGLVLNLLSIIYLTAWAYWIIPLLMRIGK